MHPNESSSPRHQHVEPLAYSVDAAIRACGIGRTRLYQLMNDGTLASTLVGKRRLIPADALRRLVNGEG